MPCIKCEDEKWRWGESGECQYDTLAECETANADYYTVETEYDYTLNFTHEQMEELHEEGKVLIHINGDEEGEEMDILFTYNADRDDDEKEEEIYEKLSNSLLDDELDEYIVKLTNSIKKL